LTTVAYIIGSGHSGTTLLDQAIGGTPKAFSTGELRCFWHKGWLEGRLCGCQRPVRNCPFWEEVASIAFGEDVDRAVLTAALAQDEILRTRPRELARLLAGAWSPQHALYARCLTALYAAISQASGCEVIVDSSKVLPDALVMSRVPELDLRVIHIVRDPRGVAFSWAKHRTDMSDPERRLTTKRHGVGASTAMWAARNLGAEALRRRLPEDRFIQIRYEDLVSAPARTLEDVNSMLGLPTPEHAVESEILLRPNHTVAGNRTRFLEGPVALRRDEEWRDGLSAAHRRLVTALAAPLMGRYGYRRSYQ
jgi:hypothetical protein